jgi:N-acetyl-anhydromuramyl-L-alanine amidase AmpD
MNIDRSMRLPDDQYYQDQLKKSQIYLHHTVGGSAKSTFEWWKKDPLHIGCAYIVDRDGTIFEVFEPNCWCHHLGLDHHENKSLNEHSIGIEIASEGALKMVSEKLFAFDGKMLVHDSFVKLEQEWRGYQYFDAYEESQIASVIELVNYLCDRFGVPRELPAGDKTRFDMSLIGFSGVLSHCNVRSDKTDVHPMFPFNRLFNEAST